MALTKISGSGTIVSLAGVDTVTGTVTASGSGSESAILVGADLTIVGSSTITFAALTADALSTIHVTANSKVTVAGTGVAALNNFTIGTGGSLTLDSGIRVSALQTITFTDATGALSVSNALITASLADTINGFQPGNSITLDGAAYTPAGSSYNAATGVLTLVGANGTPNTSITVDLLPGLPSPEYFNLSLVAGNETITLGPVNQNGIPACYLRGTLILTDKGEVAVEALAIGDRVITASGAAKPIRWIGRRSYARQFVSRNPAMLPVLFKAGSLGAGLPRRDLYVSPKHAMYLRGALVPADCLVNGVSVLVAGQSLGDVHYHHIELEQHDVVFAEGVMSESYVEDNNRDMFHNAGSYLELYPDARAAKATYCAPWIDQGAVVEEIRSEVNRRIDGGERTQSAA